ncbi:glutamate synthase subunit beta [Nitratifractor sp.]
MLRFFELERIDAVKRDVVERIKDFDEIYEIFRPQKACEQADRCIQCGDPYCHNGCPLHNFIPHWLKRTAEEDLEFAFNLSNESSPFPEVMGRICPHDRLCEGSCTLNDGYGAITIGSIETFISEEGFKRGLRPKFSKEKTGKKVAIVGAGPAGLSAATFLLREGIDVEIFDRQNRPGGLLTYGIPGFKLNKQVVQRRIDLLRDAGAVFHQNTEVGRDVPFEELVENFDAVFIGVGATKGRRPGINGEDAKGCYLAMEFLVDIQKKLFGEEREHNIEVKGKRVVVIGGGDTAMDCVRTALREQASEVKCLYRRDAHNMPGSRKEYLNAKEEGVEFEFYTAPKEILRDENGAVIGVEMVKTRLGEPDANGRQRVEEIPGSEFTVPADVVIFALGFDPVAFPFLAENGIETDKWGGIVVDENYETTKAGVYAGGDCHRGADLVVTAARDGREAARAITRKLLENTGA